MVVGFRLRNLVEVLVIKYGGGLAGWLCIDGWYGLKDSSEGRLKIGSYGWLKGDSEDGLKDCSEDRIKDWLEDKHRCG